MIRSNDIMRGCPFRNVDESIVLQYCQGKPSAVQDIKIILRLHDLKIGKSNMTNLSAYVTF